MIYPYSFHLMTLIPLILTQKHPSLWPVACDLWPVVLLQESLSYCSLLVWGPQYFPRREISISVFHIQDLAIWETCYPSFFPCLWQNIWTESSLGEKKGYFNLAGPGYLQSTLAGKSRQELHTVTLKSRQELHTVTLCVQNIAKSNIFTHTPLLVITLITLM